MVDVMQIPLPDTHIWPMWFGWIGLYIGGRLLMRGVL